MIPADLDTMEPGPVLGVILSAIDIDELSGHQRVIVLRARQRMASHYLGQVYTDMAAVADAVASGEHDDRWAAEAAAAEIRVALRLTRRAAETELAFAMDLRRRLPGVADLLASGAIDVRRARVISYGTGHLPDHVAARVAERILVEAPRLTTGQLAARLRRVCIEADPEDARTRYERAVEDRRIVTEANDSGAAHLLGLDLPPDRVSAIASRINQMARRLRTAGESRTMDQLRADVFLDLLEGHAAEGSGMRGSVDIHVDLATLARLADDPGELAGYGPVVADIARQVADRQRRAQWRFTVTDPVSGSPLLASTIRRRPTVGERRLVESRNPTCVFPGCRMPAAKCDLDHRDPWSQGGPTTPANLAPLCRHDHRIRHEAGWSYRSLPNGHYEWTTRLGHTYTAGGMPP